MVITTQGPSSLLSRIRARNLGIRGIPEVSLPGHSSAVAHAAAFDVRW
ncbi:hypothetical protein O9929_13605 [Vibrio lentus]|nr:hypothetical protein [Vibrio lentus]